MFPIRIFSQTENPISLISISKFGYVKGWFWRTFPEICLNHPGNSKIDNKTSFPWVGLTDASDRDPRTAWSAHRSLRVGAIFFGFYWSWCGAVLKFQNFSGAAWCVDQPALVRGSLASEIHPRGFFFKIWDYICSSFWSYFERQRRNNFIQTKFKLMVSKLVNWKLLFCDVTVFESTR